MPFRERNHRYPMPTRSESNEDDTLKVIEERLAIHREVVETGAVRVRLLTSHRSEIVTEPLVHRGVRIERVLRNTPVAETVSAWYDGDVMVVPVYEEIMVKQLVLKEELRLIPTATTQQEAVAVELTTQSPVFERRDGPGDGHGEWHELASDQIDVPNRSR